MRFILQNNLHTEIEATVASFATALIEHNIQMSDVVEHYFRLQEKKPNLHFKKVFYNSKNILRRRDKRNRRPRRYKC